MIMEIPIQCNMAEISLNKIPQKFASYLIDLYFLKTFFGGLMCVGRCGQGLFSGELLHCVKTEGK